jgi:hypothetical protein
MNEMELNMRKMPKKKKVTKQKKRVRNDYFKTIFV